MTKYDEHSKLSPEAYSKANQELLLQLTMKDGIRAEKIENISTKVEKLDQMIKEHISEERGVWEEVYKHMDGQAEQMREAVSRLNDKIDTFKTFKTIVITALTVIAIMTAPNLLTIVKLLQAAV